MTDISKAPCRKEASMIESVKSIAEKAGTIPVEYLQSVYCKGADCKVLAQCRVQSSKASHSRDVATNRPNGKWRGHGFGSWKRNEIIQKKKN